MGIYVCNTSVFYIDDDDEDEDKRQSATSKQTVIELDVPPKAVGSIIGRQGANIKEVSRSGVYIKGVSRLEVKF